MGSDGDSIVSGEGLVVVVVGVNSEVDSIVDSVIALDVEVAATVSERAFVCVVDTALLAMDETVSRDVPALRPGDCTEVVPLIAPLVVCSDGRVWLAEAVAVCELVVNPVDSVVMMDC
ncbi:hypothetical protein GCM10008985_07370 [Halococcus dombrowskii]|uniref:Uncharacterized protein n=1 Tax=Halococcus dombrowskii TaxID=179637 RepID=A0AAV3SE55_HALDO